MFQPQTTTEYGLSDAKEQTSLFFLSKAPKGNVYGTKTPMHHLTLNRENPVSYSFEGKEFTPHTIAEAYHFSSDDFLNAVLITVLKRNQLSD
ncbi:hypothetical protein [Beggiatoa leptomitoformis]|uniref:Uncharacterized protein n=1 Tax=Beggiatoa leptomitoformis TaxID=288004 RepID=A0A650GCQ3_9GAMM|nr:hypothetical protein [Beggiatoa leptomitoformis]QGX03444.1 hypothetical protein AL038_18225 [Beggiatoa leptomitoformis]QGX04020.1 hypothetical protein BLE401_18375 [Beggiatoa leptomitoformis]